MSLTAYDFEDYESPAYIRRSRTEIEMKLAELTRLVDELNTALDGHLPPDIYSKVYLWLTTEDPDYLDLYEFRIGV